MHASYSALGLHTPGRYFQKDFRSDLATPVCGRRIGLLARKLSDWDPVTVIDNANPEGFHDLAPVGHAARMQEAIHETSGVTFMW